MHRLFVALRPPASVRSPLLDVMSGVPGARWQDDDQLHITLRFVGEVDGRMAEDVAHALGTVRAPALSLDIAGVGRFDTRGRANALWAGVRPRDAIAGLHRKVDQALVRCGLPPEGRAYLPHLTLARLGRMAGPVEPWLARHAGLSSPTFEISHMMLFESHLGSEGARYETVARYPLVL
jgi:RNA 2',3'-cyclic 3'-phosphodiesterase